MIEKLHLVGEIKLHRNGVLILEQKNLVVDAGLNFALNRLKDGVMGAISHLAIGADATAAAPANTDLGSTVGARKPVNTVTVTGNQIEIVATFDGATYTHAGLREAGIFNAIAGGQMLSRVVFAATPLPVDDTLQLTWTLTLT
jgi:hypothetical protein